MAWPTRLAVYARLGDISLGRTSPVGLALLVVGAAISFLAGPISRRLWPQATEQSIMALRLVGVGIAMLGTLLAVRVFR